MATPRKPERICAMCGLPFQDKNGKSKACPNCRDAWRLKRKHEISQAYYQRLKEKEAQAQDLTRQERFELDIHNANRLHMSYGKYMAKKHSLEAKV